MTSQNSELLALQCRQWVLARIPQDLIERFEVKPDEDFKVEVGLKREPTAEELENLNGTIMQALEEFRQRLGDGCS